MAAPAPLERTLSDLKTASLPAQRAAKDEAGDGCSLQYAISDGVKLRDTKVGLCEGTAEMSSKARNNMLAPKIDGTSAKAYLDQRQRL